MLKSLGIYSFLSLYLLSSFTTNQVNAATKNDHHLAITHCYHWLNQKSKSYLTYKYNFAKDNGNELTFYTTPYSSNGSVAGPGLYCAKSPSGSYSYGDRLIRIELVDDVVMLDDTTGIKYCGTHGITSETSTDCQGKDWDIKFYDGGGIGNSAWYVIQNPMAIEAWSANSDQLKRDLETSIAINGSSFQYHANTTLQAIEQERNSMEEKIFYNENARLSLIDLVKKDPEKLESIPPLNIVTRISADKSDRITNAEKIELIKRYLYKALKSDKIAYKDYKSIADRYPETKKHFIAVTKQALKKRSKYNGMVLFSLMMDEKESFQGYKAKVYQDLTYKIFGNKYHLTELSKTNLEFSKIAKQYIAIELAALEKKKVGIKTTAKILDLLSKVYSAKTAKKKTKLWEKKIFTSSDDSIQFLIAEKAYNISKDTDEVKTYCELATNLTKSESEFELKVHQIKIPFGLIKDNTRQKICNNLSANWKIIKNIPADKVSESLYIIQGRIQSTPYLFLASTREDAKEQCSQMYNTIPNKRNVHQIFSKVNAAEERTLYSNTYIRTKEDVCNKFLIHLNELPTRAILSAQNKFKAFKKTVPSDTKVYTVEGRIQNTPYFFYGTNRDQIAKQCTEMYDSIPNKRNVYQIYSSINGAEEKTLYRSTYIRTKDKVCNQFLMNLNELPTEAILTTKNKFKAFKKTVSSDTKVYTVEGRIQNTPYFFYGTNRDQIAKQCTEMYDSIPNKRDVYQIYSSINGAKEKTLYRNNYIRTKDKVCNQFLINLNELPTEAILTTKNKFEAFKKTVSSDTKVYTVEGRIQNTPYFFYGTNRDQIAKQCTEMYDSIPNKRDVYQIYSSINGAEEKTLYRNNYIRTKDKVCNQFLMNLNELPTEAFLSAKSKFKAFKKTVPNDTKVYTVEGKFQNTPYFFYGINRDQIITQCKDFHKSIISPQDVYNIYHNINDSGEKHTTSGSYLQTKEVLCNKFENVISNKIPSIAEIQHQEEVRKAKVKLAKYNKKVQKTFNSIDAAYKVSGKFDDHQFFFYGDNLEEITTQCLAYHPHIAIHGHIIGLEYNIKNSNSGKASANYPYWTDANTTCVGLASALRGKVLSQSEIRQLAIEREQRAEFLSLIQEKKEEFQNSNSNYKVAGKISNYEFYFHGRHSGKILEQCNEYERTVPDHLSGNRLKLFINENSEKTVSTNVSTKAFCQKLAQEISFDIPNEQLADRLELIEEFKNEAEQSEATHKIVIDFKTPEKSIMNRMYIAVNTTEEIQAQCEEYYPNLEYISKKTRYIEYQVNNGETQDVKLNKFKVNGQDLCKKLSLALFFEVPTASTVSMKAEYDDAYADYKVSGIIGRAPFYFYGNSSDEIKEVCLELHPQVLKNNLKKRVKRAHWTIEGVNKQFKTKLNSSSKKTKKFCKMLSRQIDKYTN